MANIDITLMQQRLKQLFPEIPDNIIYNHAIQKFPHDIQKCIEVLKRYRHRQTFLTAETKTYDVKGVSSYQNHQAPFHSVERQHNIYGQVNGLSSPPSALQNPVQRIWVPPTYSTTSGGRSVSVSGVSPVASSTATSEFHSTVTTAHHPRSAPVMPSHYEPFPEYRGLFNPNMDRVPPISETLVYPMHGESYSQSGQRVPRYDYNYEMHVKYTQVFREQVAQKKRLHHKLTGDKQKVDELKADIFAMEQEIENRKEQRKNQNDLFPMHEEIRQLREATTRLRDECDRMSKAVDDLGEVPLGETSLDFYTNINPGQCGPLGDPPSHPVPTSMSSHPPVSQLPSNLTNREHDDDDQPWSCTACTFLNNGALNKCEICDMPRFSSGRKYPKSTLSAQSKPCYCHQPIVS